jgi:hypothetical protein
MVGTGSYDEFEKLTAVSISIGGYVATGEQDEKTSETKLISRYFMSEV